MTNPPERRRENKPNDDPMPELPEVETTRRGIAPHLLGHAVSRVVIRESRFRWPISESLPNQLPGAPILRVDRRGKYLLIGTERGTLLVHLGMSGSLRLVQPDAAPRKHDHVDLILDSGLCLRFHDPRRFGAMLWTDTDPLLHPLLRNLGPEPLEAEFDGRYLHGMAQGRSIAIKPFLMNSQVVVGVGNIYASESLFLAGILPTRAAGRVSLARCQQLAERIREVLEASIAQGGTTLRDFVNEVGNPGYFRQTLRVYERCGEPCRQCGSKIRCERLGQRSTFWCSRCQR